MSFYKDPSFQDRVGRAADAKRKALEQLRSKPPIDEKVAAERQAARLARETAEAEKRAAAKAARDQAQAQKRAAKEAAAELPEAKAAPTEAERKAARDARYAARKSRK